MDVTSRAQLGEPLTGHTEGVWSVAFSPDGTTLASGSGTDPLRAGDYTIILWDVDPTSWRERSCARANRDLTLSE